MTLNCSRNTCWLRWCVCMLSRFSHVQLFLTPWTIAHQAPLFMEFPRQEYWSGLTCPSPEDFPNPGIKPASLCLLHSWPGMFFTTRPPVKPWVHGWMERNLGMCNMEMGKDGQWFLNISFYSVSVGWWLRVCTALVSLQEDKLIFSWLMSQRNKSKVSVWHCIPMCSVTLPVWFNVIIILYHS